MNERSRHRAFCLFRRVVTGFLVLLLVFGNWGQYLPWQALQTLFSVPNTEAATGDYSIFTNTSGAARVTTSPLDVTWDTKDSENGNITLAGNNSDIDLSEGGKYLVLYNVWTEKGTGAGADRRSFETNLTLGGVEVPYGRAASYFRDASGEDVAAYAAGATILDATAGEDLAVQIQRDDTNTGAESYIRPGTNGVNVLKLNDNYDYLRLYNSTRSGDISGNTSFTDVTFDTSDEVDTGSFDFTASSTASDITLKGNVGDKFLITTNVRLENDSGLTNRQNYETRLTLDGIEVPGTRSTGYIRGLQGTNFTTITYTGIVEKTQTGDQTLNLELRRESVTGVATDIVADETALSAVALPGGANYVMLTSAGSSQTLATAQTPFTWNEQVSLDGSAFSHSTTSNNTRVNINTGGDYLFFSTAYTSRSSDGDRNVPRIDWRLDGLTVLDYGGHGSFNRGDQGADDAYTSGSSGGALLSGLSSGQYLELLHSDETSGTPNAAFPAQRIALQGIDLVSLAQIDTTVSLSGAPSNEVAPSTTDFLAESIAIKEETAGRNVTNLVFSEQGTVDAASDLNNISVYYDIDNSSPYNCASESYNGTEPQFGSTDTNGFTSADGTVSFTDSVGISPTAALCAYVVLDIKSGARDDETVDVYIADVPSDVVITGSGSLGPTGSLGLGTDTTVRNAEITLANYHWRNDDGSESGATSATGGSQNTPGLTFSTSTPQRLRMNVFADGTGSSTMQFRLEYAEKAGSCSLASGWSRVGDSGGVWDLYDSANIINGADTTDIPISSGGLDDPTPQFLTDNNALLDTTDQTGSINLGDGEFRSVGEFGSTTVSNGAATVITLENTYTDPIITASVRYSRSGTANQRTSRIVSKSANSFTVLVENYNDTLTAGNTTIDYVVMEAGEWDVLNDDGAKVQVFATSTSVASSAVAARSISSAPVNSSIITYPTPFTDPVVLASVTSNNDSDWVFASVYDGSAVTSPPSGTTVGVFMNENFESDGHAADETVDVLVFEGGDASYGGTEYRFTTSGSDNVTESPTSITYTSIGTAPAVTTVQSLTTNGADGGFAMVDTDNPATATDVTVSIDEDGASADRGHGGAEEVAAAVFSRDGRFFINELVNREFLEMEYAIQATASSSEGVGYCFRVSDAGTPLRNYNVYPEATLNADVTVSATGTQTTAVSSDTTNNYIGGSFAITDNVASRMVESITIAESGTVDAAAGLSNIELYYENDTVAPYDCASESYAGTELQYGSTDVDGFSSPNGTSTFTGSVEISTTSALCVYTVMNVSTSTANGETIGIGIFNPSSDVVVSSGSVGPGSTIEIAGNTTIQAPDLTQSGYHWRENDGDEASASSANGGSENTSINDVQRGSIKRLRLLVENTGGAISDTTNYRLEYGTKSVSCAAVSNWQDVDVGPAFVMASTSQLVDGNNTTNIGTATGGITDPGGATFVSANSGQKENDSQTAALAITTTEFAELEYAISPTDQSGYDTDYCFRVTDAGSELPTYNQYGELTTQEQQDFFIQRGTETITGTSTTLTAGVDYTAPSATSSAFIRITNTHMTGAGGAVGAQDTPDDFTAYIENPENLETSVTIARPATADNDTRVSWEIVEYLGIAGADNEVIVRDTGTLTYGANSLFATGTAVTSVNDNSDIVVFITGQDNPDTGTENYNTGLSISSWHSTSSVPVFERGDADGVAARLSYAVVEFAGLNWQVQRAEHTYSAAGTTETESIAVVNSLSRTFLHTQKLSGDELYNLDETGHEVWLSSIGALSFELESGATNPSDQRSVAWVIENTQIGSGEMTVYQSNGTISSGGGEPATFVYSIGDTINPTNASIWTNNQSTGPGNFQPRAFLGARILSSTEYEFYRADDGQNQDFRTEVVEWPVAELSIRQNYYRLYVDNDALTPTDPWPLGSSNLGENTSMTALDEPLGEGERVRLRTSLFINNASMVADSKTFKLQFGRRDTTCSAVSSWTDVGAPGSGEIWRGYNGAPSDGTAIASTSLLLSVADIGGTYEENNDSAVNPATVDIGQDVEYDWVVENNGALQRNSYCFRMVEAGGVELDGYEHYPTVRTSGYTPVSGTWRWYDDETNETPTNSLGLREETPISIANGDVLKLRVAVDEIEGAPGNSIKFNLQYSQFSDFRNGGTTLTATSSCSGGTEWCYADGVDTDNEVISSSTLPGVAACSGGVGDGCGLHNEASGLSSPFDHAPFTLTEHEFTLQQDGARVNATYYFRLVDATNGQPVVASSTYPSVKVEGAGLTFTVNGLASGVAVDGVPATDASTTPTSVGFGTLPIDTEFTAAQELSIDTNATDGYQVFTYARNGFVNTYGTEIPPIMSSNAAPAGWSTACLSSASGCFGYHTSDDVLSGGSARFSASDSYAPFTTQPQEIMFNSAPAVESHEFIYKVQVQETQAAGDYETNVVFIATPAF